MWQQGARPVQQSDLELNLRVSGLLTPGKRERLSG